MESGTLRHIAARYGSFGGTSGKRSNEETKENYMKKTSRKEMGDAIMQMILIGLSRTRISLQGLRIHFRLGE